MGSFPKRQATNGQVRQLVKSIMLFNKKLESIKGEALYYNDELNPKLKKQVQSIVKQCARFDHI